MAVARQADALLGALEQHEAELVLQLGDLAAQRGLRDMQFFRGAPYVFLFGDSDKVVQLTYIEHFRPPGTQVSHIPSWTVLSWLTKLGATKSHMESKMSIKDKLIGTNPLGFGTAPLGNMFRNIPEAEAEATVDAAWEQGIRYFDTAPFYGAGLAEIRLGRALAKQQRSEYVLSTKVGRLVLDETEDAKSRDLGEKGGLFEHGLPNKIVNDYSATATLRSIEDSLKRLGTDYLDIVYVHDVAQDFYGDEWLAKFEEARTGAFRVLTQLRAQGVIKAWGLGVNRVEALELTLDLQEAQPDGFLLAGRYTLLDHERALQRLMPAAAARNVDIVVGGPYSSGVLAGGTTFEYQKASPEVLAKVERIRALAARHGISVKAAALQFALANPAVAAVIPGASRPERILEDRAALAEKVPADFWRELREQGLVAVNAPLPL
jgi:D-threo-aldose 1-dehydrogenase